MDQEKLERQLAEYPICEYAFIKAEDLTFLEQVRYICRTECPQYGTTWSCPPAVGTVEECQERCQKYKDGLIFTTVAEVTDMENMQEMLDTRKEHEEITQTIRALVLEQCKEVLTLSTESCTICEHCAYPDAPCRHPDNMFPCVESYGILVTDLAEKYGIQFMNGANIVTWFSLILFT